ncbi:MAG: hypothetical protein Q7R35_10090 [Elusimicrobiota bacterium]|nr:hypothetical protein [Elusimicrobiota bacterium]
MTQDKSAPEISPAKTPPRLYAIWAWCMVIAAALFSAAPAKGIGFLVTGLLGCAVLSFVAHFTRHRGKGILSLTLFLSDLVLVAGMFMRAALDRRVRAPAAEQAQ